MCGPVLEGKDVVLTNQSTATDQLFPVAWYLFTGQSERETVGIFYETFTHSFHFIGEHLPEYSLCSPSLSL